MNLRHFGINTGTPVLFLHGFTGSGTDWLPVIGALEADRCLYTVDLPGHGANVLADEGEDAFTMAAVVRQLHTAVEQIGRPVVLVGYSMGGRVALSYAAEHPEMMHAMILESTSPGLRTDEERQKRKRRDDQLAETLERNGMVWFVRYWERLPLWDTQRSLPDEIWTWQQDQRLANDPVGLARSLRGYGTGVMPPRWNDLRRMKFPVQLIVGELDEQYIEYNSLMKTLLPRASLAIIPAVGHNTHLENVDAFRAVLRTALDAVQPTSAEQETEKESE